MVRIPSTQRSEAHSSGVCACAQTTATAAVPDCNTSSSSSEASHRWSRVLAPPRVSSALLSVAASRMFHTSEVTHSRYQSGNVMPFLFIIRSNEKINGHHIFGRTGRRSSTVFGFFKPYWYSYSYHNNRAISDRGI